MLSHGCLPNHSDALVCAPWAGSAAVLTCDRLESACGVYSLGYLDGWHVAQGLEESFDFMPEHPTDWSDDRLARAAESCVCCWCWYSYIRSVSWEAC